MTDIFLAENKREKGVQELHMDVIPRAAASPSSGWELTCTSPHLCCSHTIDNPSLPPCLVQSSRADPQRRGDLHTGWGPAG